MGSLALKLGKKVASREANKFKNRMSGGGKSSGSASKPDIQGALDTGKEILKDDTPKRSSKNNGSKY